MEPTVKAGPRRLRGLLATAAAGTLMAAVLLVLGERDGRAQTAGQQVQATGPACPASLVAGAHDYHGLTLTQCNFNGQDLSHANFKGATLSAVVFIRAKLTGADFSGAVFADSGNPVLPNDFSFADLGDAKFVGAKFTGPTYLTYATFGCADFSQTDLARGQAVFGADPLLIEAEQGCRPKFQNAVMNCEFVGQWNQLDLSGADISACADQLKGFNFANGLYAGVVFDHMDLTGSQWSNAVLEHASFQGATLDNATGLNGTASAPSRLAGAKFNNASVQGVDLSNAQLYGAQFTNANLSHSSLAGAFLSANPSMTPPIVTAAVFDGAHLRNVDLSNAQLQGASFQYASFYGSFGGGAPTLPCATAASRCANRTGFTCACARASGANLSGANFSNAYLFGADFSGATTVVNGTQFGSAILTGASFAGARFQVAGGAAPDFTKALLQGAVFDDTANLVNTSMLDAFVDFGAASNPSQGNIAYLLLSADYTRFRGWSGAATPCVQVAYGTYTVVPSKASMTCPNGSSQVCGAGRPAPSTNPNWASAISLQSNLPVPGWYVADATYEKAADQGRICGGKGPNPEPGW